ncbi:hypothetical protein [Sphingomonas sp.]|uniref:hypothetical protein n=1 Tax=Sphingomonas sp. TaxID=28214 RepID=UPI003CC61F7C
MRTLLLLLALVVLIGAGLLAVGFIRLPVERTGAISVQTPRIGVETGRVSLGTEQHTVTTPTLQVQRPADNSQAAH